MTNSLFNCQRSKLMRSQTEQIVPVCLSFQEFKFLVVLLVLFIISSTNTVRVICLIYIATIAHATVGAGGDLDSLTCSSSSASLNNTEICMEPNERTPLLSSSVSSQASPTSAAPGFYTKECLNWRTIGLLVMFTAGLSVATYLLWRESKLYH